MTRNLTPSKAAPTQVPNLETMRKKDREIVKGIFKFYEVPGGTIAFVYKAYHEDPVENYTMTDGQVYTIPLGVAKHLNKNGWYPEYEYGKGDVGVHAGYGMTNHVMKIGKKIHRYGFQSLEFVDVEELNQPLMTVEHA